MNFFEKMLEVAKSMGVKNFSYYKNWALDHLKKQLKEEDTVTKALEYCEEYMEKAYGVGTIRTWKGKKYIKGADKKWRRYYDKYERGTNLALNNVIRQLQKIDNMEDLAKFININRARFVNENGLLLPEAQEILKAGKEKGNGIKEERKPKAEDKVLSNGKTVKQVREEYGIKVERNSKANNKDPESRSNQEENKRDKRIGNIALWDGRLKSAIKSGDAEKIKSTMAEIEKEFNEAKGRLKGDELDFAETEYKFRKRDADKAISDLDEKEKANPTKIEKYTSLLNKNNLEKYNKTKDWINEQDSTMALRESLENYPGGFDTNEGLKDAIIRLEILEKILKIEEDNFKSHHKDWSKKGVEYAKENIESYKKGVANAKKELDEMYEKEKANPTKEDPKEDLKAENQKKLVDLAKKHQENLKKIAELSSKRNQEMNKKAEDFYREHGKIASKEDLGSSAYDKEIESLLDNDAKIQNLGETIVKDMDSKHPDIEETEQEKHDNRSNAMKGNDNAKKDGVPEEKNDPIKELLNEYANDTKLKTAEKKVNIESISSDNVENREFMCGTYHENGLEITTDGVILAAMKSDYPDNMEGVISSNNAAKKFAEKKLKKLNEQTEFANTTRKLEHDADVKKYTKMKDTIDAKFPNWKRVMPDRGSMTDVSNSFKNTDQILKYCLLGMKMDEGRKDGDTVNVPVRVGGKIYNPKKLFNALSMAKKNGLDHFEQTENKMLHIYGDKGDILIMPIFNGSSYIDAESGEHKISESTPLPEEIHEKIKPRPENETPEIAAKNKEFEKYGYRIVKMSDGTYSAGYKKENGEWLDGGLRYGAPTMEEAEANIRSEIERVEYRKKQEQEEKERKEKEEKEKKEIADSYGTFFSGKDAKTKAREIKHLEKRVNFGNGKIQSYKEYIEDQFRNGDLEVNTHEENKLKGPSRVAYNRMNGRQQEEYERRIQEAGKKTVYEIRSKSKGGYYDLGKIAYDYAKYLIDNNGGIKKSFSERIEEIMNKSNPDEKKKHDLEYYKKWALSVLSKQSDDTGSEDQEDGPNEDTIVKALEYCEMMLQKAFPVGTVREWKGQKYVKIAPNKWKPKYDNMNSRGAKMSLSNLKKAVAKCNSEDELYNLMNSNASRFRDPKTGYPFPEVQELHDLVMKRGDEISNTSNNASGEPGKTENKEPENGGEESKKDQESKKYSDAIAAIQNGGNKVVSAENKLAAGRPEDVVTDAGEDVTNNIKNAAKKEEQNKKTEDNNKPVGEDSDKNNLKDIFSQFENKDNSEDSENTEEKEANETVTDSQTNERVISKYMGDQKPEETRTREGNKEIVTGNNYAKSHKLQFKQNLSGVFLGKPQMDQELFEELSKYDINSDSYLLAPKYGLEGAEFLSLISKVKENRVNIV